MSHGGERFAAMRGTELAARGGNDHTSFGIINSSRLELFGAETAEILARRHHTPRGNRKTRVSGGVIQYYCYDAADQLTYRGPNPCSGATNFSYDANGNMTQNGSGDALWEYQYDGENRLIQVKQNGSIVARYTYDFLGRRQSKTVGAMTRNYHYDGLSNRVLYETDGSENVVVWYTWAGDRVVSQTRGTATYFYAYDGHGDVVGLLDEWGNAVNTYAYDVWGNPDPSGTTETVENPYRYAAYRWDAETGLYYLNARYYDPDLGRFLTQDTWKGDPWRPWTQNLYVYVGNNPVNYVDPTGHSAEAVVGVAATAIAVDGPLPIGDAVAVVVLIGGAFFYGDEIVEAAKDAWNSSFGSTWYAKAEADKTATDIIAEKKKGAINGEFPKEMYDKTLKEIEKLAKAGDKIAQKAKKLLTDKRFDKGDNRK